MTEADAIRAEAAREDGWPYPDNDSDLKEERRADLEDETLWDFIDEPFPEDPYLGTYSED